MQFPVVKATIRLSPTKKEKSENSGSLFVVKEVKSASQRLKPAGSKVVEISVPREELNSRARHESQSPSSSVPLIELNINRAGFKVRQLLIHSIDCSCMRLRRGKYTSHNILPCRHDFFGQTNSAVTKHPSFKLPDSKNSETRFQV